jgi:hypothetical protein
LNISFTEESAKFYPVVLTNEKGIRSYVYVLKFYERISFESEIKEQIEANANRLSSDEALERVLYLPIVLALWSHISQPEFYQSILIDLYSILKGDCQGLSSLSNYNQIEVLRNYQNCELLNYFLFISTIVKPGPSTKLKLNLSTYN